MVSVSVIVPVYNAEKTLERCLEAFINQTYSDFEVICVNDGSKDTSWQILEKYAQKDSRIKVYNQDNHGVAYTRKNAIQKSCGKYLMFCDSDDWYEPNMIEEMVNTIEEQKVDVVMCSADVIDISNGAIQKNRDIDYNKKICIGHREVNYKLMDKINVLLWNKIFKREIIEKYNVTYPNQYEHDDIVFVYKYFAVAKTYYGINKKLYHYLVGNKNSIMGQLFTGTNEGKKYDFIYAFDDLFKFLQEQHSEDFQRTTEELLIEMFKWNVKFLKQEEQNEAYEILRNMVINSDIVYLTDCINSAKTNDDCNKFIKSCVLYKLNFIQKIFSVTNAGTNKVVMILGFPIIFKRKQEQDKELKVYVIYNKPSVLLKNDICTPIQAGRDVMQTSNPSNLTEEDKRWMLENTIGDNVSGSISELNEYFNEHTAIYWLWKNYNKIGNPGYIGFVHYRTLFLFYSYPQYKSNYLDNCGYDKHCIMHIMKKKKAITGEWVRQKNSMYDWYKDYKDGHNIIFIDELLNIFKTKYKKNYKHFYKWMKTPRRGGPFKNMFIMKKDDFFKYCNWIYPILFDLYSKFERYDYRDNAEKRNIAWISELLTAYYFDRYIGLKNCKCITMIRPIVE